VFELAITGILFLALWVAAWWSLSISYWLTLAICLPAGVFLTRLFLIQHDCGHGAFFRSRVLNDWIGRILGVITLTPYDIWRRSHTIHHGTSSNLGKRGTGDLDTLTVREYYALPRLKRLAYRLYRHPLVMFGIGPAYMYLLRNRLPLGFMTEGPRYWFSAMGTNLTVAISIGLMIYLLGLEPFFFVFLPTTIFAATIGIWLFYVQHQFEHTYWASDEEWNLNDAALYGSSHFDLPGIFKWLTAYIGIHHVHHFYSRIPFYRLPEVLRDYPELANVRRLTFLQSFSCLNLRLWDENQQRLVPFPALGASATR
jgi:acyl-lipid omega-6 desaturase (Delta-12 desaturase)